jgi:glycosyltransferase involved in cell wall biosynthesis
MKVMTAIYTIRRGGAYDRFIMMLEAFLERNCETHCLSLTPIPINHSYFHNHVIYVPLKTLEGFMAKLAVVCLFPLWSFWIAWRKKIDLIVAFGSLYAFLQGFSKWILRKPMVTFIRGNSFFALKIRNSPRYMIYLNKIVEYLGLLFSDRIITNNIATRDEILKNLEKRKNFDVQVLYNNIPPMNIPKQEDISQTRDKYGIPEDAKVLVTAGVLNRGKNIETLMDCLSKILARNIYLIIAGDGLIEANTRYRDLLQGLAKKLEIDKRVIFTGWLEKEELWKIYLASDLFVLPSLSEGMPNAILEALGTGLPCIGSNIAGVKEILQYEELMFNPSDNKELAYKIMKLLNDRMHLDWIKGLCEERKNYFLFDWKKRVFQLTNDTRLAVAKRKDLRESIKDSDSS